MKLNPVSKRESGHPSAGPSTKLTRPTLLKPSVVVQTFRFAPLLAAALVAHSALLAQTASPSIQGIVVRVGTNSPLSNATVELRGDDVNASPLFSTTTEDDGRFFFANVQAGRYQLVATRPGYVRPSVTVTVSAGQPLASVQLPMTPTGAIYGRVTDARNDPIPHVEVRALSASYHEGRRVFTTVQTVRTNDLGEYRLFWLAPGRYYLSATHPDARDDKMPRLGGNMVLEGRPGPGRFFSVQGTNDRPTLFTPPEDGVDRYVSVYFPGTTDERAVSALDLGAGSDYGSVNLVVGPVRERRVRGTIINGSTGAPAQFASLRTSFEFQSFSADTMQVDPDKATFDVGLLPGERLLVASASNGIGYVTLQVGDSDLDNVTIVTLPEFPIRGRLVVDGKPPTFADVESLRISLRRDPAVSLPSPTSAGYSVVLSDGSFATEAAPGVYRVNVAPILNLVPAPPQLSVTRGLAAMYVKSIRLGTTDVLNEGLRIDKPPTAPLEIVIGTSPGAVAGRLVNERQEAVADGAVVLLPNVRRRTELYRTTVTDPSGQFRFEHIAPGDYKIFASTSADTSAWYDPEFVRAYESSGTPIRIVEGKTENVEIPISRPR